MVIYESVVLGYVDFFLIEEFVYFLGIKYSVLYGKL